MSARHRVEQAVVKMGKADADWTHDVWEDGKNVNFIFQSDRSAQLMREAFWLIFKTSRKKLIHNGRKP